MPDISAALGADLNHSAHHGSAYPTPAVEGPPPPPPHATFRSPHGQRRIVEWLILGDLAVKVAYGATRVWAQLIRTHVMPRPFEAFWDVYDVFSALMPFVFFTTLLAAGVVFIQWHRQMLRNLVVLGCDKLRHPIELASWAWFIPFVAWVVPYQSIAQVARHSRPPNGPNTPALVGLWWGFWLSLGILNRVAWVLVFFVETLEDWVRSSNFELAVIGVHVIAGLLAILMMRWLSRQQVEHHRRLVQR